MTNRPVPQSDVSAPPRRIPPEDSPARLPPQHWILTPSHLLEYLYCPRFTYFEFVLGIPQHQEKRFKVRKGREAHELRQRINPRYLRKRLGVVRRDIDVRLISADLHLSARIDEVLTLADGDQAPFDYKYAEYKHRTFRNHRIQAALYGLLVRELRQCEVRKAFLCYIRSNFKVVEIPLAEADFAEARACLEDCRELIVTGYFPPATPWTRRCDDCCYANICPKV